MSRWRRLANWIDFFVSLLCAVFLGSFVLALAGGHIKPVDQIVRNQEDTILYLGVFLALLLLIDAILRAVQNAAQTHPRPYLHFDTPGGRVSISAVGVEGAIQRTVNTMSEVADARVRLIMPPEADLPSEIRIRCRLYDRPNVLGIQDQIRAVATERYQGMFPGDQPVPPVQVSVENIVFETPGPKTPSKPEPMPAADEPSDEQPFRAQYPVDQ